MDSEWLPIALCVCVYKTLRCVKQVRSEPVAPSYVQAITKKGSVEINFLGLTFHRSRFHSFQVFSVIVCTRVCSGESQALTCGQSRQWSRENNI